jgi:hypothetical protein
LGRRLGAGNYNFYSTKRSRLVRISSKQSAKHTPTSTPLLPFFCYSAASYASLSLSLCLKGYPTTNTSTHDFSNCKILSTLQGTLSVFVPNNNLSSNCTHSTQLTRQLHRQKSWISDQTVRKLQSTLTEHNTYFLHVLKVVAYQEFPLPKEKKQKSTSRLLRWYCIYTHNPSWYNLCHITQRPPLFCNSLRLHFVKTSRAICKIDLFLKVSRYFLTLRSSTTSHRYTGRQENTCTHANTTDSIFLCNSCPLCPGNERSLFTKIKKRTVRDTMTAAGCST